MPNAYLRTDGDPHHRPSAVCITNIDGLTLPDSVTTMPNVANCSASESFCAAQRARACWTSNCRALLKKRESRTEMRTQNADFGAFGASPVQKCTTKVGILR